MIEAFLTPPNLIPVSQDTFTLSTYNFWRVSRDGALKYDGPGGSVVGEIPAGFNTVHGIDASVDGWLRIADGTWIPSELTTFQQPSYFTGFEITDGLEHPSPSFWISAASSSRFIRADRVPPPTAASSTATKWSPFSLSRPILTGGAGT
ncbi:MAG: hypothetical protein IPK19_24255 [Chloroflexi bacterium]|nr:hypothetical protein [Chloroflexota bacterium]